MIKLNKWIDVKSAVFGAAVFYVAFLLGRGYEQEIQKAGK